MKELCFLFLKTLQATSLTPLNRTAGTKWHKKVQLGSEGVQADEIEDRDKLSRPAIEIIYIRGFQYDAI